MRLGDFIRENKETIDEAINASLNFVPKEAGCSCPKRGTNHYHDNKRRITNEERRLWVMNDEGLYDMARRAGCRI